MPLYLQPLSGKVTAGGKAFPIPGTPASLSVGRSGGNDLCVDDISVSSLHAKIESSGINGVDLIDCGSSNGTFLNGVRIEREVISPGDLIRFASTEFRVVEAEEAPEPVSDLKDQTGQILLPVEAAASREKQETISALEEEKASREEELKQRQEAIDQLEAALAETKGELEQKTGELEKATGELEKATGELEKATGELEHTSARLEKTTAELDRTTAELAQKERELERSARELRDGESRIEKLASDLRAEREGNLQREGQIASLQFEVTRRDGMLSTAEAESAGFAAERDEWHLAHDQVKAELETRTAELATSRGEAADLQSRLDAFLHECRGLTGRLLEDWKTWFRDEQITDLPTPEEDGGLSRAEAVRKEIRAELDRIEPIWHEFGDGVQAELQRRCNELKEEQRELVEENRQRKEALEETTADLATVREEIDEAVRRAQGLSRRGTEVAIPERFESLVIAKDREQEIYRALITQLEFFDHLLQGYRRNRKMKDAISELEDFRARIAKVLEDQGVEEFDLARGTLLTLKQRREVQILGKKGWGTREYVEQPYQPGEVTKVVRSGYRVGEGDHAVILRKVEVLIREVAE